MVQPLWKTLWRVPRKLKIELSYDPATPLLGKYPKEMKSGSQRDICTPIFIAALFIIAKIWKQPKYLLMDEIRCGKNLQWNIIQPLKKKVTLPFITTWMELKGMMLREKSQTEKDKFL